MIDKEKCEECGKLCKPYDDYTPFGCEDPEDPEPLDPEYICKKCFPKVKKRWIKNFKEGSRNGDYRKSMAEMEAAKECKLKWVGSGTGILGTPYFINPFQYVDEKLYDRISKLPYWGWCMKCGSKRKGGYCSNKECENSFNIKKI